MRTKSRGLTVLIAALAVMLGVQGLPLPGGLGAEDAYAAPQIGINHSGSIDVTQGDEDVAIDFTIENGAPAGAANDYTFNKAELIFSGTDGAGITVSGGSSATITVGGGDSATITFYLTISKSAKATSRDFEVKLSGASGSADASRYFALQVGEGISSPSQGSPYTASVEITHKITPSSGFSQGDGNNISFEVYNKGNTAIRNAELVITLPEGMSVYNASNSNYIGSIPIGERKSRSFPVSVEDSLGGKSYPVTVKLAGVDQGNQAVSLERTFYIPVTGSGSGKVKDLSIEGISVPSEVGENQDFNLSFNVVNKGTSTVKDLKVYAELPEGLLNKTTNTFVLSSIAPGESKSYTVTMFVPDAENKSYAVKLAAEPLTGTDTTGVAQYVSVFAGGGSGNTKTPQLMVDQYSYGGSYVMASGTFGLDLGLYNTSDKPLSNIKVTVSSDDGTFVPVHSSNAFFIEKMESKGHYQQSLTLSVKPDAEQKTTSLKVSMSYEDGDGNAFTAEDTVSIPVMQEMRLSVDEIVPPYECYAGNPGAAEVNFYNMGKTTLGNLKVTAEGDFDVMEANSYFVGNMQGGSSDKFSFTFIPRQVGPVTGKVIFTYEDAGGVTQTYEVPFTFEAMEMPVYEDPGMMPEEEGKKFPWSAVIFGGALLLAIAGVVIWQKVRKHRMNKKLELEDAAFYEAMDLNKLNGNGNGNGGDTQNTGAKE